MEQKFVIVIGLSKETGEVVVQGPLQDKVLCYGMLEAARDAVRDYRGDEKRIVTAPANVLGIKPS